eukprot:Nk52_evm7s152 gene=Nk52_evmTU7s152
MEVTDSPSEEAKSIPMEEGVGTDSSSSSRPTETSAPSQVKTLLHQTREDDQIQTWGTFEKTLDGPKGNTLEEDSTQENKAWDSFGKNITSRQSALSNSNTQNKNNKDNEIVAWGSFDNNKSVAPLDSGGEVALNKKVKRENGDREGDEEVEEKREMKVLGGSTRNPVSESVSAIKSLPNGAANSSAKSYSTFGMDHSTNRQKDSSGDEKSQQTFRGSNVTPSSVHQGGSASKKSGRLESSRAAGPMLLCGGLIELRRGRRVLRHLRYFTGTMAKAQRRVISYGFAFEVIDACLRGVSQIIFMNNPLTGLLALGAYFVYAPWIACAAMLGCFSSTMFAYGLGFDRNSVRNGLFGFNGTLTGAAIALFQSADKDDWQPLLLLPIVFASALSSVLVVALGNILVRHFGLSMFTLPFHIMTWTWLLASQQYAYFPNQGLSDPSLASPTTSSDREPISYESAGYVFKAWALNISQLFLIDNRVSAAMIVAGTFICSPISSFMAVFGSGVAVLFALAVGAPESQLYAGLLGFNAVLVSVAIGGMFYVFSVRSFFISFVAIIFTCMLHGAVSSFLQPMGMPALTFPGAIGALVFTLISGAFHKCVPVELSKITTPEDHLRRLQLSTFVLSDFRVVHDIAMYIEGDAGSGTDVKALETFLIPIILCWSAFKNDLQRLSRLLDFDADPNEDDYDGRTALHIAVAENNYEAVQMLLDADASVMKRDVYGNACLNEALHKRVGLDIGLLLMKSGAKLDNISKAEQGSELCRLAYIGDSEAIVKHIRLGYDVNARDYDGRTALHIACSEGQRDLCAVLVANGASVACKDAFGNTPLQDAFENGDLETIAFVRGGYRELELDSVAKKRDKQEKSAGEMVGDSIIEIGEARRVTRGESKLLVKGKNVHLNTDFARTISEAILSKLKNDDVVQEKAFHEILTILFILVGKGDLDTLVAMVNSGMSLSDDTDYDGQTVLHVACASGHEDVVRFILSRGVSLNISNRWGETPLEIAVKAQNEEIIRLLVGHGCHIDTTEEKHVMSIACQLCAAAARNDAGILESWLLGGISPNIHDYDKRTPLHLAVACGAIEAARVLIRFGADESNACDRWGKCPADGVDSVNASIQDEFLELLRKK